MARQTLEHLESRVASLSMEVSRHKRSSDRYYTKLRLLENAIRETIVVGAPIDLDALYALRQRVPAKPRPTLREARKAAWRRAGIHRHKR